MDLDKKICLFLAYFIRKFLVPRFLIRRVKNCEIYFQNLKNTKIYDKSKLNLVKLPIIRHIDVGTLSQKKLKTKKFSYFLDYFGQNSLKLVVNVHIRLCKIFDFIQILILLFYK